MPVSYTHLDVYKRQGMHEETRFLNILLMFIGGSPGGTAGGVKTTTIAMLMLTCIAFVRGGQDTECFGRRISAQNVRMGFATVVLALICYLTGTTLIAVFEADRLSSVSYKHLSGEDRIVSWILSGNRRRSDLQMGRCGRYVV